MNKAKRTILIIVAAVIALGIYYYAALPPLNIHSAEIWVFAGILILIIAAIYIRRKRLNAYELKESKGLKVIMGIFAAGVAVYLIGALLSSPIVNAKKYQQLLTVETGEFTKDIEELSFDQIPLLDRDSAALLGNREMGSMVDMVSQFEVDELYSQINYQDRPVRVSPLRYASLIKWLTNNSEGIPAYIKIDMATQDTELVNILTGISTGICVSGTRPISLTT